MMNVEIKNKPLRFRASCRLTSIVHWVLTGTFVYMPTLRPRSLFYT